MEMSKPETIKAEAFDVMQYFYGKVHEPLIHAALVFEGHIKENSLVKAVTLSLEAEPILSCCFHISGHPYWKKQSFTGADVVEVVTGEPDDLALRERLLATKIDIFREPQVKIFLVRGKTADALYIIINHMVCDGAGFKEYLYLLSDLYQEVEQSIEPESFFAAPRGAGQLFENFSAKQKRQILHSKPTYAKPRAQATYSLQGGKDPIFGVCAISPNELQAVKDYAKANGVTLNDMVLAAYARALFVETGNGTVSIPCPVDLRRYLKPEQKHGLSNLTSNYICTLQLHKQDTFADTVRQVSEQMQRQKSSVYCLKPVCMLQLFYKLLPFKVLQKLFHRVFTIPVLSYTNLGLIDSGRLAFNTPVLEVYMTGAVKYVPYFQIAVSTFQGAMTISCNLYGTRDDRMQIQIFLEKVKQQLLAVTEENKPGNF